MLLFGLKFKGALQLFCAVKKLKKLDGADAKLCCLSVPVGNVLKPVKPTRLTIQLVVLSTFFPSVHLFQLLTCL